MSHQENAPLSVIPGAIRFNTDSMKLEYYRGGPVGFGTTTQTGEWVNLTTDSPDIQTGGTRALIGNGAESGGDDTVEENEYITISTTGTAINFGNLVTTGTRGNASVGSRTRGYVAGGYPDSASKIDIDVCTFASTGSFADYGDLTAARYGLTSLSNSTRGVFIGGSTNNTDYITLTSTGTAQDWGNSLGVYAARGCASSTRGLVMGSESPVIDPDIDYITISTQGNWSEFGELSITRSAGGAASNSVRAICFGGTNPSPTPGTVYNTIDYVTIATLGNAQDFGDATESSYRSMATSSSTRATRSGGYTPSSTVTIEYVQIMSTGNAIDFGDLLISRGEGHGCSNGHGGLG
jgi:hypothetical protein